MELGDRLKIVRNGVSQKDFGDIFGVTTNTIRRYESGANPPDTIFVAAVCKHFNISSEWLLFGEGPMYKGQEERPREPLTRERTTPQKQSIYIDGNGDIVIPRWQNPDPEMFDYIPMAEAQLSAGGGSFVISEDVEGYYAFRKTWLHRVASSTKNLVLMQVRGDSMSPTIQKRDTVMIDIGKKVIQEGMIYAIRVDSTIMIKRLSLRLGGKVLIISDNRTEFEPYEADKKDLHIIGQVIFFCRTFATD